ncbi:hypothetical protein TrVFT333_011728 [Trichoderma virens FT-333]|nr:hypothetical protein TrVFT333_011728 [Trichoderma virens FT-333]
MSNNRIPPRGRHEFNIALICALPLEASIVSALFDAQYDAEKYGKEQSDTNAYSMGAFDSHNVVLVHMPNMGKVAAATAAAHLRASFPGIQLALVVGICGGAPFGPSELLLGDVIISEGLVQYDLGRRLPNTFVRKDTPGENLPRPRPEVRAILAKLKTIQGQSQLQKQISEHLQLLRQRSDLTIPYPGPVNDQLFKPKYLHRHRPPLECTICANVDRDDICYAAIEASCEELGCTEMDPRPRSRLIHTSNESQPAIHFRLVATGDTVMRSGEDRDKLVARDKVIAFEMEGAGVWETFSAALVIKGVCDYADSHKNKKWQAYAAATAAAAAKAFLIHWDTTLSIPLSFPHYLETRQLEIMKRLYTSPYRDRKDRNPDRVAGTCEWFTQHHLFLDWKQSTSSRLLWVSADPGCGKSVLVKYLVDSILLTTTRSTVCYFFFKDDFEDQKSIVSALCCILYQLFHQNPTLLSRVILGQFEAGGEQFIASFSELWHILLSAARDTNAGEIICILDAIDECEDHGRSQLAKALCKLYGAESSSNSNLKFLVTSRPFSNIRQGFEPLQIPTLPTIHLSGESEEEMKKISAEIDVYTRARVGDISKRLKLKQNEQQTLLKELIRIPNRTYLWVYIILDLIESDINIDRAGILQATAHIPKTLDEAYDRILSKTSYPEEAKRILHIVVAAERAMSLTELGFALAIRQCHRSHEDVELKDETRLRENIRDTCGLFVTVIQSRVFLLHQTAKEFLVANPMSHKTKPMGAHLKWKHMLSPRESHKILAEISIWYLLLSECETKPLEDDECMNSRILLDYSANYWATHVRESQAQMSDSMAQSILKICDVRSKRYEVWFRTFWKKINTEFPEKFTTLMVVSYFGLDAVAKMVLSTATGHSELDARDETYGRSALSWAAGNGFDTVVVLLAQAYRGWFKFFILLLFGNSNRINSVDLSGRTPLFYAIWNGNESVVTALLRAGALVNATDNIGGTPLLYAMSYGRENISKLLLKHGLAKPRNKVATQLFFSAVEKGDTQVVELFLDLAKLKKDVATQLFFSAMEKADAQVIQLFLDLGSDIGLLEHGVNIETRGEDNQTPLLLAVTARHIDIVRLLLDHGANIESRDDIDYGPFLTAVVLGDENIAQLLLDRIGNSNNRIAPFVRAMSRKHPDIVRDLYDRGANAKAIDNHCANELLLSAAKYGFLDFVRVALARGAYVESKDQNGCTPLLVAAQKGDLGIVRYLLDRGADIKAKDKLGCTPLIYAVMRTSNHEVIGLLLERGAAVNAVDARKQPPLHYAIESKSEEAVKLLLGRGANVQLLDAHNQKMLSLQQR